MLPWDVNARAFDDYRKAVALAYGRSVSLVDRHCEAPAPLGTGARSPLDLLISTVRALRTAGAPGSELLVEYVCAELGYHPPVRVDVTGEPASLGALANLLKETSDVLRRHAAIHADGVVTIAEADDLERELADVARVVAQERHALQVLTTRANVEEVRQRIGPRRALPKFIQLRAVAS